VVGAEPGAETETETVPAAVAAEPAPGTLLYTF
jgi:hypothetical protein